MRPWEGCWQIVLDEMNEEIVALPSLYTTLSLRASALYVYAGGHFLHLRVEPGRRPPQGWPPSAAEKVGYFRTSSVRGGRCSWQATADGWRGEHEVVTAADPRRRGTRFRMTSTFASDESRVEVTDPNGTVAAEVWRRLSGTGSSALAGAWRQSTSATDRWWYLVTAGHYAVAREDLERPMPPADAPLSDEQVLALAEGFGANAGAILATSRSLDHWPMISSNAAGFEARKHETFRVHRLEQDRLILGFRADGSDASSWMRLG
jgi:hypothetical protein